MTAVYICDDACSRPGCPFTNQERQIFTIAPNPPDQTFLRPNAVYYIGISGFRGSVGKYVLKVSCSCCTRPPTPVPTTPPSLAPTISPSQTPTNSPTNTPTSLPSIAPTNSPSQVPTKFPSALPTLSPSNTPSAPPTKSPTTIPTQGPSYFPTTSPMSVPSDAPTNKPSATPTLAPTKTPTLSPSQVPSFLPTRIPTNSPTSIPSDSPTSEPSQIPTDFPTKIPTLPPSKVPTVVPTNVPTVNPTAIPTKSPTKLPHGSPTGVPSRNPSGVPSIPPTQRPLRTTPPNIHFLVNVTLTNSSTTANDVRTKKKLQNSANLAMLEAIESVLADLLNQKPKPTDLKVFLTHVNGNVVAARRLQTSNEFELTFEILTRDSSIASAIQKSLNSIVARFKDNIKDYWPNSQLPIAEPARKDSPSAGLSPTAIAIIVLIFLVFVCIMLLCVYWVKEVHKHDRNVNRIGSSTKDEQPENGATLGFISTRRWMNNEEDEKASEIDITTKIHTNFMNILASTCRTPLFDIFENRNPHILALASQTTRIDEDQYQRATSFAHASVTAYILACHRIPGAPLPGYQNALEVVLEGTQTPTQAISKLDAQFEVGVDCQEFSAITPLDTLTKTIVLAIYSVQEAFDRLSSTNVFPKPPSFDSYEWPKDWQDSEKEECVGHAVIVQSYNWTTERYRCYNAWAPIHCDSMFEIDPQAAHCVFALVDYNDEEISMKKWYYDWKKEAVRGIAKKDGWFYCNAEFASYSKECLCRQLVHPTEIFTHLGIDLTTWVKHARAFATELNENGESNQTKQLRRQLIGESVSETQPSQITLEELQRAAESVLGSEVRLSLEGDDELEATEVDALLS